MLLFSWMALVSVVRAEFLRARNLDYVRAAKALGADDITIMFRHVLPNAMVATLTFMPFILNHSITTLTALDFLSALACRQGSPSLGELLNQGKNNLQAPWLGISAFCILALMLTLLIFIGEAVARCVRSTQRYQRRERQMTMLLDIKNLSVTFWSRSGGVRGC